MKTEDLILWLKGQNITEVSENTGIPKDRMYKWTNGVASPKTEDFQKLLKYYNKMTGKSSTPDNLPHPKTKGLGNRILTAATQLFKKIPDPVSEDIETLNELRIEFERLQKELEELKKKEK